MLKYQIYKYTAFVCLCLLMLNIGKYNNNISKSVCEGDSKANSTKNIYHTQEQSPKNVFSIQVLTWRRPQSLNRLLLSLRKSNYLSDTIKLIIHIDGDSVIATRNIAKGFNWPYGSKDIIELKERIGLAQSWFNAWIPNSTTEHSIIFEDDITVSPVWYTWLKGAWNKYQAREDIAGISLQRQGLLPQIPWKLKEIVNDNQPFLFKLLGSIGFSPHAGKWKDFLAWLKTTYGNHNVDIPELITTKWYNSAAKGHMWTQHFIYYCKMHNLYTLYINLPEKKTLGAHWREKGQHFSKTLGLDFNVADNVSMNFPQILKRYNFNGELIDEV